VDALVLMVFLAALAICTSIYWRTRSELDAAAAKHQAASLKVQELKVETERIKRDIERMKTDPRMIESYARQRLGLIRTGDVVIKIGSDQEN
jgi:cell division protein FtsB